MDRRGVDDKRDHLGRGENERPEQAAQEESDNSRVHFPSAIYYREQQTKQTHTGMDAAEAGAREGETHEYCRGRLDRYRRGVYCTILLGSNRTTVISSASTPSQI